MTRPTPSQTPGWRGAFPLAQRWGWLVCLAGLPGCGDGAVHHGQLDAVAQARLRVASVDELRDGDDALHALLSEVYTGEALTRAYVDHHHARARFVEEEVQLTVREVSLEEQVLEGPDSGRLRWTVLAEVQHASHSHLRRNRYETRVHWVQTPAGPRVDEEQLLRAARVQMVGATGPARSLRALMEEPVLEEEPPPGERLPAETSP